MFRRLAEEATKKAEAAKNGKPSFSKGPSKQGATAANLSELKELRASIGELTRKVGPPSVAAAQAQLDDEGRAALPSRSW